MTRFDRDALLATVDQTLASLRALRAARDDPEQTDEARAELVRRAAAELSNLPEDWPDVPEAVLHALRQAREAAREDGLEDAHRHLVAARETLGGPSS